MKKENCIELINGKVMSLKHQGSDFPMVVVVEYKVGNKKYQLQESVKLKSKVIKLGFLPIGQKKIPKINVAIGSDVEVCYNPGNPQEAYIVDNDGFINC